MKKTALLLTTLALTFLSAQDLKTTLDEVIATNPVILERLKNYNAYKKDIDIAKSGYYPKLDLRLGSGYESTTRTDAADEYRTYLRANGSQGRIKNLGYNVYQNSLTYTHNLFEGFATKYAVEEQNYRAVSAAYSYIEQVNEISNQTVTAYLEYLKNKELLKTAQENVKIDEKILEKVKKLFDSGLTTLSEVNKIESSLALARANLVVQENRLLDASYNLEKVLGRHLDVEDLEKVSLTIDLPQTKEEAVEIAFLNNPSLLVADFNVKLAEATYKKSQAPFYPRVDVEVSANYNKNLSALAGKDDSYKGMLYISYNIFNGFSDQAAKQKSISQIYREHELKKKIKRDIVEKINLAWAAKTKLQEQQTRLKEYQDFALKTLKLYAKEYDLGRRSLLDLLVAQNDFINSKAQIISVEYSILESKFRVLDAMGTLVQTVMGDTKNIYQNVDLADEKVTHEPDTLPVRYDNDNDLIVDAYDICDNSLLSDVQNLYGCDETNQSVSMIKRYSWFLFEDHQKYIFEKDNLDPKALKKLKKMIDEVSYYGYKDLKIEIFGNAQDSSKSAKELQELSKERAEFVKNLFLKAGAKEENVTIHVNGNNAIMYSGEDIRNNRVDIVIKKLQ